MKICSRLCLIIILAQGCGVRGRPLPPELPPQLGRGEPSYKKATEGVQLPSHNRKTKENEDEETKAGDRP